ncbi:MAG: hypothetical protein NVSMB51_18300 [Solirubrobacteraceae bacterium]
MSLKERVNDIQRDSPVSLTGQLVAIFVAAIQAGELVADEQLPPTRTLAAWAGINQLTATRVYRRLQELGLVTAAVGRGTFVRGTAPRGLTGDGAGDAAWQSYALPRLSESFSGQMAADLVRHVGDPDVIALSAGYPATELLPAEELADCAAAIVAAQAGRAFQYGSGEGERELREELAQLGRRRGLSDAADDILVTGGARQALTLAARATIRPGDAVACESPSFMGVIDALRCTGAELLPVPVDGGGLNIDALEELLRRREIRLLALQPRCHNPTGTSLDDERRERLVALARRHSFFILEDALYADLRFSGPPRLALRALAPNHVIYVDSFSKTVAPGLRAGWLAASGPVLDRIIAEKRSDDMQSPTFNQLLVARFLAAGGYERQLERAGSFYRVRRDAMMAALTAEMGELASAAVPAGGGHLWVTLRRPTDERMLLARALSAGVAFVPGSAMTVERPRETHLRLSFGMLSEEQIADGVRRLAGVVRDALRDGGSRQSLPVA